VSLEGIPLPHRIDRPAGISQRRSRLWTAGAAVLVLGLLAGTGAAGKSPKPGSSAPREAVFLVVVDTLRADRLSSYGYTAHATPHIDALAARGLRFDNAQAVASWTVPSMGALLTSRYPRQLGMLESTSRSKQNFQWHTLRAQLLWGLPRHVTTLAEQMRERGFRTAAFVNQPALNANTTFARGFDEYHHPVEGGEIRQLETGRKGVLQRWATTEHTAAADAGLVQAFGSWLEETGDQRVFAWVHLLSPHVPYEAPAGFAVDSSEPSDRYDAEVRYVDSLVGKITDAIGRHAGWDRSLVVFVSDHGEEFGERGRHGHGHSLHREVTRVPLIVSAPGRLAAGVVHAPVRLVDVAPTILALTSRSAIAPVGLEGVNLEHVADRPALPVYVEGKLYGESERSLTQDGYKLIVSDGEKPSLLYQVERDPEEKHDVAASEAERVEEMQARIQTQRRRLQVEFIAARTAPAAAAAPAPSELEERRTREALRALGYLDD